MKEFWVEVIPWDKDLATTSIESGANLLVVEDPARVRELGRIPVLAPGGDREFGRDVFECTIRGREDEDQAVELSKKGFVVARTADWTVIPLENLVSRSDRIIAAVGDEDAAALALGVLEKGTRGILLSTRDPAVIRRVGTVIGSSAGNLGICTYTITAIRPVGMGDRVCVDTCSILAEGEGMLVGNTSSGFLLVHAETLENPYVAPRPFRVNAGAVHAYILMPGGKTSYLSDLKVGDRVLVTDSCGQAKEETVGRVKIERRPLLLVEAESCGSRMSVVLQNAETIRLVGEDGGAISVVSLEPGDRVLGYTAEGGRHFGVAVKEQIVEK
jgi:3-dehydroquinate synthase II